MTTSTARNTVGNVLGTVSTAAESVQTVFSTVTKSVGMLDFYITNAAEKQAARGAVDMSEFERSLNAEMATMQSERDLKVLDFCAQSPKHAELYETNYNRIAKILADRKVPAKSGLKVVG